MADFEIMLAGKSFVRPGGRDGDWWPDPQEDDEVASPFDFVAVPGERTLDTLQVLRRTLQGRTPIVFGSPHNYGLIIERMEDEGIDPDDTLEALAEFDLDAWFSARVGEVQVWQEDLGKVVPPRGPWPRTVVPVNALAIPRDETGSEFHETVLIGLVPCTDAFEVPAHIGFGGWDDSPEPVVHVAIAREWEAKFGARITAFNHDRIEFQVARPPKTRDDAERLALEHFHYSRAAIPGTLQDAAARLIASSVWQFSWD